MQNNVDGRKDEEKITAIRALDNLPEVLGQVSKTEVQRHWVTVPRTRGIYIRCRKVPLAEVYCSVSENFPLVWTNENRELSVELIPACGAAEVDEFATLPALRMFGGWLRFERKG